MNQFDFGPAAKQIESLKGAANGLASLDSNGLVPNTQLPGATQSAAGMMSAADKTKLDGVATGATANVVSDSLSDTSTTNALSAAKGKALNDSLTSLNSQIAKCPEFVNLDITGNSTKNYTISNNARMVLYEFGNSESRMAQYMFYTHSSGAVTIKEVSNGSNITVSSSGNNSIAIVNSSSNSLRGYFLIFQGSIQEVTT